MRVALLGLALMGCASTVTFDAVPFAFHYGRVYEQVATKCATGRLSASECAYAQTLHGVIQERMAQGTVDGEKMLNFVLRFAPLVGL